MSKVDIKIMSFQYKSSQLHDREESSWIEEPFLS